MPNASFIDSEQAKEQTKTCNPQVKINLHRQQKKLDKKLDHMLARRNKKKKNPGTQKHGGFQKSYSFAAAGQKRNSTAFQASMNFQDWSFPSFDSNKKLRITAAKQEAEKVITWSNVYDAPISQVPKVKIEDTRGPLIMPVANMDNTTIFSSSDESKNSSPETNPLKELQKAITEEGENIEKEESTEEGDSVEAKESNDKVCS
mmetsp:Transcript_1993/g.2801  ORF Transcript_1993/g.2801 Transcript_1993/m.2801 type:complete len:203 (+) Transcript_1993:158-766(+)